MNAHVSAPWCRPQFWAYEGSHCHVCHTHFCFGPLPATLVCMGRIIPDQSCPLLLAKRSWFADAATRNDREQETWHNFSDKCKIFLQTYWSELCFLTFTDSSHVRCTFWYRQSWKKIVSNQVASPRSQVVEWSQTIKVKVQMKYEISGHKSPTFSLSFVKIDI